METVTVDMMDWTCPECERLWEAYDHAAQSHLIIEQKSDIEKGLKPLVRKALRRREEARTTVEDHEATHMSVPAAASGVAR
jgi:hypothetical protein